MYLIKQQKRKSNNGFLLIIKCNTIFQFNCFCIYMTFIIYHSDSKRSKTHDKTHKRDVMKHRCVMHFEKLINKLLFLTEINLFFYKMLFDQHLNVGIIQSISLDIHHLVSKI